MTSNAISNKTFAGTVEAAVEGLLRVKHWGDFTYINLPLIYPGGSFATVRVRRSPQGFHVDDGGFAYRELESIGAQRSFGKTAGTIAEREELCVSKRAIYVDTSGDELTRAICDVAMASHAVAEQIYRKAAEHEEGEIEDYLRGRLVQIFGEKKLEDNQSIQGSSTTDWDVSAIINIDDHRTVFQAVGAHANSIYRTSTVFHDLAELDHAPRLVAVVKDKEALGSKLLLLGQVGRVIESGQPDDVWMRAAA